MTFINDVFPKLRTPKNMVRSMPKKSRFRGAVEKQHCKCAQTLFKFEGQLIYLIYWSLRTQLSYKMLQLEICKISRLFPNTLSADGKYSLLDRDNLTQEFRCNYLKNKKYFPNFFLHFWNIVQIWNIFKKEITLIADAFPKLRTPRNMVRSMPKKSRWRGFGVNQHGKCAQTLLKYEGQLLYHIFWSLRR